MYYDCKVYFDGSGYTAILPSEHKRIHKSKHDEDLFGVLPDGSYMPLSQADPDSFDRITSTKSEFDVWFESLKGYKEDDVKESLSILMRPFFESEDEAKNYVERKLINKSIARQARSTRFHRKAYLNSFSFYCTFTYDDTKCTYDEFDKTLRIFFNNQACRNGWKIMMVPEWGKENERYHLHALISIPKGSPIPGDFVKRKVYNKKKRRMVDVSENTYFSARWGLNDWQSLSDMPKSEKRRVVGYVVKYLTKTDASVYYSRGLPTFIKTHIRAEDILDRIWRHECKAVLFDDWHCFYDDQDVGEYDDDYLSILGVTG